MLSYGLPHGFLVLLGADDALASISGFVLQSSNAFGLESLDPVHHALVCLSGSRSGGRIAQTVRFAQHHKAAHPERVGGAISVSIFQGSSLLLCDVYLRCLS